MARCSPKYIRTLLILTVWLPNVRLLILMSLLIALRANLVLEEPTLQRELHTLPTRCSCVEHTMLSEGEVDTRHSPYVCHIHASIQPSAQALIEMHLVVSISGLTVGTNLECCDVSKPW